MAEDLQTGRSGTEPVPSAPAPVAAFALVAAAAAPNPAPQRLAPQQPGSFTPLAPTQRIRLRRRPRGGKKVLTVAVAQSVDSLSPFLAHSPGVSTSIHRLMYEYLTNYDPKDGHAVPGLATAVEVVGRQADLDVHDPLRTPSGPTGSRPPPTTRPGRSTR